MLKKTIQGQGGRMAEQRESHTSDDPFARRSYTDTDTEQRRDTIPPTQQRSENNANTNGGNGRQSMFNLSSQSGHNRQNSGYSSLMTLLIQVFYFVCSYAHQPPLNLSLLASFTVCG